MTPAKNDITGDSLTTKAASNSYRDGWDRIFGNITLHPECTEQPVESPPIADRPQIP